MEKSIFEENFIHCLNTNFPRFSKYFDYQYRVFFELNTSIFEVTKCQILELHQASITLTNNILERLLKLALINNEVGIRPIPTEKWNLIFKEADRKYSSLSLGNSIEACKKNGLLTKEDSDFLFGTIRELMRNGFAHADPGKILSELPDEAIMFQVSLTNPKDLKEVHLNQKTIPILQSIQIGNFAKANSSIYLDYVFSLLIRLESHLVEKNQSFNS